MIERTQAFKTSNNKNFDTLEAAQQEELAIILSDGNGLSYEAAINLCAKLVSAKEKVLDILSTTPTSKPRARAINGGRKKRTPKTTEAAANLALK